MYLPITVYASMYIHIRMHVRMHVRDNRHERLLDFYFFVNVFEALSYHYQSDIFY